MHSFYKKALWILPLIVILNTVYALKALNVDALWPLPEFDAAWMYLVLVTALSPWFFQAWRIQIWMRRLHHPVTLKNALSVAIGSDLGAAVSPTAVGGAPVRMALLMQKGLKGSQATFMAMESTVADLFFFGITIITAFLFHSSTLTLLKEALYPYVHNPYTLIPSGLYGLIALAVSTLLLLLLSAFKKLRFRLVKFLNNIIHTFLHLWRVQRRLFIWSFLLNAASWIMRYLLIFFLLRALYIPAQAETALSLAWLAWLFMLIVPTPGAAVGAEAVLHWLYSAVIQEPALSLLVIVWRITGYYWIIISGSLLFPLFGQSD